MPLDEEMDTEDLREPEALADCNCGTCIRIRNQRSQQIDSAPIQPIGDVQTISGPTISYRDYSISIGGNVPIATPPNTTPQPTNNTISKEPTMKYLPSKIGIINKLGRPIGTELEMSSCGVMTDNVLGGRTLDWWWTEDATITTGGKELVINPAAGDAWIRRMSKLIDLIAVYKPSCDKSCGFHVHIQSDGLHWYGLRRLITIWCRIENEVFESFCHPERQTSRWCIRNYAPGAKRGSWQFDNNDLIAMWKNSRTKRVGSLKRFLIEHLYGLDIGLEMPKLEGDEKNIRIDYDSMQMRSPDSFTWKPIPTDKQEKYKLIAAVNKFNYVKKEKRGEGGHRYGALNLHSHFHRGTVEFRLKEGTVQAEELIFWPLFCGWIVESAARLDDKTVLSIKDLRDWCGLAKRFAQPQVIAWVKSKLKPQQMKLKDEKIMLNSEECAF